MPKKGADDWVDTTADQDECLEPITSDIVVLRELPAKPTERQASHAATHNKQPAEEVEQDYKALAPAFIGVSAPEKGTSFAETRAEALFTSLQAARSTWQATEADLENACFDSIGELGVRAHLNTVRRVKAGESMLIPTVILSSSGLAAGNQRATYNRLMDHLKKGQNAYAAQLQPSHFQQGVGGAISAAISQLSEGATADDMHALYQWYQDETGGGATGETSQARTPAPPAATPAPTQTQPTTQGKTTTQGKRTGRTRKPIQPLPGQIKITQQFVDKQKVNSQRQLVLVLTQADQVPTPALQDLTAALQQDYARFPVTLVLCINRPPSLFLSTLPLGCCSRLALTVKDLPTQAARLEALIQGLLLAKPPGITLLSERPLLAVLQHYEHQAGSADGVMHALEVAHTLHHAEQPLATLAHTALNEHVTSNTNQQATAEVVTLSDSDDDTNNDNNTTPDKLPKPQAAAAGRGRAAAAAAEAATPGLLRQLGGLGVDSAKKKARTSPVQPGTSTNPAFTSLEAAVGALPESLVLDVSNRWGEAAGPGAAGPPRPCDPTCEGDASVEIVLGVGGGSGGVSVAGGVEGVDVGVCEGAAGRTKRTTKAPKHADGETVVPVTKPKQSRRGASVEPDAPQPSEVSQDTHDAKTKPAREADTVAKGSKGAKKGAAAAAAALAVADARAQVVRHVREAVDTLARWWLGVALCHATVQATGACAQRPEYRLTSLYCALASPAFNHVTRKGRVSACQHMLSELFGQGPLSVRSLTEDERIDDLLETVQDAIRGVSEWRVLSDITELTQDIARLRQNPPVPARPPRQATDTQAAPAGPTAADKTPTATRHASRTGAGQGPSPTSLLRRGFEATRIASPPAAAKQQPDAAAAPAAGAAGAAAKPPKAAAAAAAGGSKARRALLEQSIAAEAGKAQPARGAAGRGAGGARGEGSGVSEGVEGPVLSRADHVANWLRDTVPRLVAQCPFTLPGAVVFTFDNARALEDAVLMPQPRAAVHDALLHPSRYLGPHCIDDATPMSTDIEVAYQRLVGRDSVSINAWFEEFCDVQSMAQQDYLGSGAMAAEAEAKAGTSKGKAAGSKASEAKTTAAKGKRKAPADEAQEAEMEQKVVNWAARFSQAVNELQYMGVVRPNKRRADPGYQVMFKPHDMDSAF